jgi:hypothetical protein
MSIPIRIWRVIRGRWLVAEEATRASHADQEARAELSESLRSPVAARTESTSAASAAPRRSTGPAPRPVRDPLAADLALLGAPPACDMATLDRIYTTRLGELQPETYPPGSPERDHLITQRLTLAAAYERLRDAINTTETRFEKLEF